MPPTLENKIIRVRLWTLIGSIAGSLVVLCGAFWTYHAFQYSNLRENYEQRLQSEVTQNRATVAQTNEANKELREGLRRESELSTAALQAEHKAKLRELELINDAAKVRSDDETRHVKDSLNQIIDQLRHQLSVSRSTLEIRADGEFIGINELLLNENAARQRMADRPYTNVKRMLLPNYSTEGWQKLEKVALAQVEAYILQKTIKLPPEDANLDEIDWQPLFTIWMKDSASSVGAVGAVQLTKQEFTDILRRGNTTTTTVTTNTDGTQQKTTTETKINVEKLSSIPLGVSAYGVLAATVFSTKNYENADFRISSFSARTDAMHFSGTIALTDSHPFNVELLVMQDETHVFILFDSHSTENALDPISREASDWLRGVRFVK